MYWIYIYIFIFDYKGICDRLIIPFCHSSPLLLQIYFMLVAVYGETKPMNIYLFII